MNIKNVQAIFFDFDGVILNSTWIKTDTFRDLFSSFGEEIEKQVIDHHIQYGGISRVEKIAHYYEEFLKQPLTEEELKEKCIDFSNRVKDKVVETDWIPGAEEFLDKFHKEIPLFVISGTPEDELREIINRRKMTHYFSRILGSPVKKPVHVRDLLSDFRFDPKSCFFIGDALTDYNTAVETDTHFIGIEGFVEFPKGTLVLPDCFELENAIAGNQK